MIERYTDGRNILTDELMRRVLTGVPIVGAGLRIDVALVPDGGIGVRICVVDKVGATLSQIGEAIVGDGEAMVIFGLDQVFQIRVA